MSKSLKYRPKTVYITDEEIDTITAAIYNDDTSSLFKNIPKDTESGIERQILNDLSKGQDYYIVPQTDIVLRKDGRLFNCKFIRPLKPLWTPLDLIINARGKQIRFSEVYKSQNWKFDQEAISKRYKEKNWGISITNGYKETFKELYG